eukprot:745706-Hanusia_phi.AAC.1
MKDARSTDPVSDSTHHRDNLVETRQPRALFSSHTYHSAGRSDFCRQSSACSQSSAMALPRLPATDNGT